MTSLMDRIKGSSVFQRAIRSSALTLLNFGSAQVIRLGANLILTRLLFPEAFGIMALVTVLLTALHQFSDIGIVPSVIRSKRGDEPVFLDTAWTIKIIRSFILWTVAFVVAKPMSVFYNEPLLAQVVPLMAITLVIDGFVPTKIETALRNMQQGRMTLVDISSSLFGAVAMIVLAYFLQSIWALPIGTVVGSVGRLGFYTFMMPGRRNNFAFERNAAVELVQFGKWIFPSTIASFIIIEADKFFLGRYVSLETLGIYNIGFFLASFPLIIGRMMGGRVMLSYFKSASEENHGEMIRKSRKLMFLIFGGLSAAIILLVIIGHSLVTILYDDRYVMAGLILVTLTSMHILQLAQVPYQYAVLGLGHGRDYFTYMTVNAILVVASIWIGLEFFGLLGAIIGQGVAFLLFFPFVIYYAKKMKVFDPVYVVGMLSITVFAVGLAWWLYSDQIKSLIVY